MPTGFSAHAARDSHAGTAERLEHEALGNLQAELFQARVTVNQLRAELEQTKVNRHRRPLFGMRVVDPAGCWTCLYRSRQPRQPTHIQP
jgi:hypothetical protein